MSIPSTNITFEKIKSELGRGSNSPLDLNDPEVRKLASAGVGSTQSLTPSTPVTLSNLRGKARIQQSISGTTTNFNTLNSFNASGNYVAGNTWSTLTVLSGVVVGASGYSDTAMTITPNAGDITEIVNYGTIVGHGGDGASAGGTGGNGSDAVYCNYAATITNYGNIWGGGGGGGGGNNGGDGSKYPAPVGGGQGGGGAGYYPGQGANAGGVDYGGNGSSPGGTAGGGGNGGGPGSNGNPSSDGNPGGIAGKYINGNAYITWAANGDRRGYAS